MLTRTLVILLFMGLWASGALALDEKDQQAGVVACDSDELGSQEHNPGLVARTSSEDPLLCFLAYVSDFHGGRQNQSDDKARYLRVPLWVAQRVAPSDHYAEARERPSSWFTVPSLNARGIAPTDSSYVYSKSFRQSHPNWYDRGHLAQKYLAERMGPDGGWFTHSVANAVPQRSRFNSNPWLQLECFTGGWANRFGPVWIITGPVFLTGKPHAWLAEPGRPGALPVAIPDALFKVVVRRVGEKYDALAFIYPQDDPAYAEEGPWNPAARLVSIAQIEHLTQISFFPADSPLTRPKEGAATGIWPLAPEDLDPGCKRFRKGLT